ncbi:kelch-like protein 30 isoform X2 [Erinaceus europaeus]|uniref:Kelch-like protein 30 isoform X2 n=1 Tax=Erinaceus europaeus TaxID=9365 RepID=A0ABM3XL31_ERIEU|nr:kelch-like protein 30 isoform X2 [Erinaceus europaeus]
MVRPGEALDFELPSHARDTLAGLQRLRWEPKLADVTLLVSGQELPAHRGVLALSSPFFRAMFAGDFAESQAARVELRGVCPRAAGALLDFAYSGRLRVTRAEAQGLAVAAARLHFPVALRVLERFLRQQLDATNCLGLRELGERLGLAGLAAHARAFLRLHFGAVARGAEFLELPAERLAACLGTELLQARPERARLGALLRWVCHDPAARQARLPALLGLVPPHALPRAHLRRLLASEPLLRDCAACREALAQGPGQALPEACPQNLEEVLVVVGGRALEEEEAEGQPAAPLANFAFYHHKASGSRGTRSDSWSTTQAWCFPGLEAAWRAVAPMHRARTNHASATLNGEVYAVGGTALDAVEVETYDPHADTWTPVSPAPKYVSNFSAAGCQGRLYLVGSSACKYNALALQCYQPATDTWTVVASPFLPKYLSSPRCTALQGALYLVGDNTKKVHVYDPDANLWQKVQPLHSLHENGALVALGDTLLVTGGRWQGLEGDYHVEMEVYRPGRDAWARLGALPRLWLYHGACSLLLDLARWTQPFRPVPEP